MVDLNQGEGVVLQEPDPVKTEVKDARRLSEQGLLAESNLGLLKPPFADVDAYLETQRKMAQAIIEQYGEREYRKRLADARMNQAIDATVEELSTLENTPEDLSRGKEILEYLNGTERDDYIGTLEDSAGSEVSDLAHQEQAMQDLVAEQGWDNSDILRDMQVKTAMTQEAMRRLETIREQEGFVHNTGEFLVRLIPFVDTYQSNIAAGDLGESLLGFGNINTTLNKVSKMSPLEYGRWLDGFLSRMDEGNISYALDFLRVLQEDDKSAATIAGAIEVVDTIPFLGTAFKLGKGVVSGGKSLSLAGGKGGAAQQTVQELLTNTADEQTLDLANPTLMVPTEQLSVGVSGAVQKTLERNERLSEAILRVTTNERLNDEALEGGSSVREMAIESTRARIREDFDNNVIFPDIDVEVDPVTKVRTVTGYVGMEDSGFPSELTANLYAQTNMGLKKGAYDIYTDPSGLKYIEVKRHVAETGVSPLNAYAPEYRDQRVGFMRRWVFGASTTNEPRTQQIADLSDAAKAKVNALYGEMQKSLKPLNKKQRKDLEMALSMSHTQEEWWDLEKLTNFYQNQLDAKDNLVIGRAPTEAEIQSYYSIKQMMDLDFHIRNGKTYKDLATRGYRKATISSPNWPEDLEINAIIHAKPLHTEDVKFWDVEVGYVRGVEPHDIDGLVEQGYVFLQPQTNRLAFMEESGAEVIMVKRKNLSDTIIDPWQLGYVGGGHRLYDTPWFVKQNKRSEFNGNTKYLRPFVHYAGDNLKELQEHVIKLEKNRVAYKAVRDGEMSELDADRIIRNTIPGMTYKEMDHLATKGAFDVDEPYQIVRDGQNPDPLLQSAGARAFDHGDLPNAVEWMDTSGRMYYGNRGTHLPDIHGNPAPVVAPYDAASRALANSLNTKAFQDYQFEAVERWVNTFGAPGGPLQDLGAKANTPYERFRHSTVDSNHPQAQAALTAREHINALLGVKTESAQRWERRMYDLAETMSAKGGVGAKAGKWVWDIKSKDPLTASRSMVFDAKLGFFGVDQLLLQTQTAFTITAIDPKNGAVAWKNLPILRAAMINGTDEYTAHWTAKIAEATGENPEWFGEMVDVLKNSGITDIGRELAILNDYSSATVYNSAVAQNADKVRQWGRWFFYEGERINKIVGFNVAYRRWREANPNAVLKRADGTFDPDILGELVNQTNVFSVNMTRSAAAWWQKGVMSVPTQFASYQARLLELMLPQVMGGSKALTSKEKMQLALGQVFLYGSAGVPTTMGVQKLYENAVGENIPEGPAQDVLMDGLWDSVIFPIVFGIEGTAFKTRAGVFGQDSLITDMWDPDTKWSNIAGGAVFSTGNDLADAVLQLNRLAYVQNTDEVIPISLDVLSDIMKVPSTGSRIARARRAYLTGYYVNKRGRLVDSVTRKQALAIAGGIPLKSAEEIQSLNESTFDIKKHEQEIASEIRQYKIDALAALGRGDKEAANAKMMRYYAILQVEFGDNVVAKNRVRKISNVGFQTHYDRTLMEALKHNELKSEAKRAIRRKQREREGE